MLFLTQPFSTMSDPVTVGRTLEDTKKWFLACGTDHKILLLQSAITTGNAAFFMIMLDWVMCPLAEGGISSDVLQERLSYDQVTPAMQAINKSRDAES